MPKFDEPMTGHRAERRTISSRFNRRHRGGNAFRTVAPTDNSSTVCVAKTTRGNLFDGPTAAKIAARRMSRETGKLIHAYKCHDCKKYHVGKPFRETA